MRKILSKTPEKCVYHFHEFGKRVMDMDLGDKPTKEGATKVIDEFQRFLVKECDLPAKFSEDPACEGFNEDTCKVLAKSWADSFWTPKVKLGFEDLTEKEVFEVYKSAM